MKKLFLCLLSVLLVMSSLTVFTFATGDNEARVGETEYATLESAIEALNADEGTDTLTLTLLKDITRTTGLTPSTGHTLENSYFDITRNNVIIDGNSKQVDLTYTLASGKYQYAFGFSGMNCTVENLTVNSNVGGMLILGYGDYQLKNVRISVITGETSGTWAIDCIRTIGVASQTMNLIVDGGFYENDQNRCINDQSQSTTNITIKNNAEFNSLTPGALGRPGIDINKATTTIIIDSAIAKSTAYYPIRLTLGTLNINGGIFYGTDSNESIAIGVNGNGFLNINGGTFISSLTKEKSAPRNAVVGVASNINPTITITNTSFINFGIKSLAAYNTSGSTDTLVNFPANSNMLTVKDGAVVDSAPVMQAGAQVRLVESESGIRFVTDISAANIANAEATLAALQNVRSDAVLTYGTLVLPTELLGENELTIDTADVVDIPATEAGTVTNPDGSITLRAALIGIPTANYGTELSARAYIKITFGAYSACIYSDYNVENNSRAIATVAQAALNDTGANYTQAQIDILNSYCLQ